MHFTCPAFCCKNPYQWPPFRIRGWTQASRILLLLQNQPSSHSVDALYSPLDMQVTTSPRWSLPGHYMHLCDPPSPCAPGGRPKPLLVHSHGPSGRCPQRSVAGSPEAQPSATAPCLTEASAWKGGSTSSPIVQRKTDALREDKLAKVTHTAVRVRTWTRPRAAADSWAGCALHKAPGPGGG